MQEPVGYMGLSTVAKGRVPRFLSQTRPETLCWRWANVLTLPAAFSSQLATPQGMSSTVNHFSDVKGTDVKRNGSCVLVRLSCCCFISHNSMWTRVLEYPSNNEPQSDKVCVFLPQCLLACCLFSFIPEFPSLSCGSWCWVSCIQEKFFRWQSFCFQHSHQQHSLQLMISKQRSLVGYSLWKEPFTPDQCLIAGRI